MDQYLFRRRAVGKSGEKVMLSEPDWTVTELVRENRLLDIPFFNVRLERASDWSDASSTKIGSVPQARLPVEFCRK